jgi:hypothetical protein
MNAVETIISSPFENMPECVRHLKIPTFRVENGAWTFDCNLAETDDRGIWEAVEGTNEKIDSKETSGHERLQVKAWIDEISPPAMAWIESLMTPRLAALANIVVSIRVRHSLDAEKLGLSEDIEPEQAKKILIDAIKSGRISECSTQSTVYELSANEYALAEFEERLRKLQAAFASAPDEILMDDPDFRRWPGFAVARDASGKIISRLALSPRRKDRTEAAAALIAIAALRAGAETSVPIARIAIESGMLAGEDAADVRGRLAGHGIDIPHAIMDEPDVPSENSGENASSEKQ